LTLHMIGELSLSLSTVIYCIWFIPQLWLNFKRKDTQGLSIWMHGLLLFGYCADLLYGFGEHMPWQYRAVTIIGLMSLGIEHIQFGRYGLRTRCDTLNYTTISTLALLMFSYALYNLFEEHHHISYYNIMGGLSAGCWFLYMLPQIVKNYYQKSTKGLSKSFVILSIIISICDTTSAYALGWSWPSLIGAPLTLVKKTILLWQYRYYDK
jgi:uncharacterized protein with PQ loop repeat